MLRNYVTTAVRSLRRHLGVTTLNVLGLGVGIGVSVLLLFFVRSELAVNDLFPNAEHIYRIDSWQTDEEDRLRFISTNPLGETIEREAPGVEARTWLYGLWVTLGAEGDYYRRDTFLTNSEFFDVFDLPLRHGAPETALDEPRSAVLRADVARTLFGTIDVVGRTLDVQTQRHGSQSYTVTGVWEPLPRNSVTQFRGTEYKMLLSEGGTWDFAPEQSWSQWQSPFLVQYVRLAEQTDVEALHATIEDLVATQAPEEVSETLAVALLGLLGLTGFTVWRRTTEIGIRKALGASVTSIVRLLSMDVATLVGLAFLVGGPAAYLLARWWLQNFARRIPLTPGPFLAVGGVALCCALAAVSGHALRAARIDPARALRDE